LADYLVDPWLLAQDADEIPQYEILLRNLGNYGVYAKLMG
jgi:hypothetical protein